MHNSIFQSARLSLTLWYTVIIVIISVTISTLLYLRTTSVFNREFERIRTRIEQDQLELTQIPDPGRPGKFFVPTREEFERVKREALQQLVLVNLGILVVTATGAWILAGRTLKPIQQVMNEQRRFIGDAAHELRTPITALKTSMEVNVMDPQLGADAKQILKENLADLQSLEMLTEGLLKLSTHDLIQRDPIPVALDEMVHRAVKHLKPLAQQKQISLSILQPLPALSVLSQPHTMLELVLIFLENAIKYTPNGGTVTLNLTQNGAQCIMTITDTGTGIAEQHLPHIFDVFYRADTSRAKSSHTGYGLGLSIAKKIVDSLQGSITVTSRPGKTTFKIHLPMV